MREFTTMRLAGETPKAMPRRIAFTAASLASLACPEGRRDVTVYDTKVTALAFVMRATGACSFYLIRRVNGRPQRIRLGGAELPIEQARRKAMTFNGKIAAGVDPSEGRRAIRLSETIGELWERYKSEHLELRCTGRTIVSDASRYQTCLASWASRKARSITEADVRNLHTAVARERGKVTANRAITLLRRMMNFGRIEPNPASKAVTLFREKSRERFVQADELPKLFAALDAPDINPDIRDFIRVALFTGARRSNVLAMRMEEINLAAGTWTIPAGKSKSGEAMTLPLSPQALEIIRGRIGHPSGFIFAGPGKSGHLEEVKWTWRKVLQSAGLEDLRLHDLRRTLGSFQAALGASLPIIGRSLGHHDAATTQIYARLNLDPVRASVNAAAEAMQTAGTRSNNIEPSGRAE